MESYFRGQFHTNNLREYMQFQCNVSNLYQMLYTFKLQPVKIIYNIIKLKPS